MAQILIGSDGLCFCNCADKCICKDNNTGMGWRCNEQQLIDAGHHPIKVLSKEDDIELGKYICIDGKNKRIQIKCIEV